MKKCRKKTKLLCVLHRSPPYHGAAKVGDYISECQTLLDNFNCKFITIKSSESLSDIGTIRLNKFYNFCGLYIKVLFLLLSFRPEKIYFTASVSGVAFYRDLLLSSIWKAYGFLFNSKIFYHYHTKGILDYVKSSKFRFKLAHNFLKNINIILLSPLLKNEFSFFKKLNKMYFLPNSVPDRIVNIERFNVVINNRFKQTCINVVYLSNLIPEKGYWDVLKLARYCSDDHVLFHFAGAWVNESDRLEFYNYIDDHNLTNKIVFHGYIESEKKIKLLEDAHLLIFPTRYKKEAFPLVLVEALSYGIPVISTNEGAIPDILDERSGIIVGDNLSLQSAFKEAKKVFLNIKTAQYCRERYLTSFSLDAFDNNLVNILKD